MNGSIRFLTDRFFLIHRPLSRTIVSILIGLAILALWIVQIMEAI